MGIRAVLFDLDNTLTHRDQSVQAYSRNLYRHYQLHLANQAPVAQQTIESDHINVIEQIVNIVRRIDNGGYPKKELLTHGSIGASVAYALLQELSWANPPRLEELTEFWFSQFGAAAVAMTGAVEVLQKLKQQDYKLAVISNGGHATRLNIIKGLGIFDYFDAIFSSESVGVAKPKAEIFLKVCSELQVEPEQSLYIGDHPINDYQGATQAGLNALLIEGFHALNEHPIPKDKIIQRLDQIFDHLS